MDESFLYWTAFGTTNLGEQNMIADSGAAETKQYNAKAGGAADR
jgi:hypothetical protein